MVRYVIRRALFAIPTLLAISLVIFTILYFAPGDPTGALPLTIPAEVREAIRESLGLNDPFFIQWLKWNELMFINEPLNTLDSSFGICIGDCENRARIISWASRAPAMDIIWQRLPQTLWVLGLAFVLGTLMAIPIGVYSAYKQYSAFDNVGTVVTMLGYSVPTFFTG
ncbi:MAG: ABC transporter permease, partial [Actinomycetota bacterium]|nr:ABC transporter permease [Actinomycetota bacterium]